MLFFAFLTLATSNPSYQSCRADPRCDVIAQDFSNLRGLTFANGKLYAAEAGRGPEVGAMNPHCFDGPLGRACLGFTGAVWEMSPNGAYKQKVVDYLPSLALAASTDGTNVPAGGMALGAADVLVRNHDIYVVMGAGFTPETEPMFHDETHGFLGTVGIVRSGRYQVIAKLYREEFDHNPDHHHIETNPYGITSDGNKMFVSDAAANCVYQLEHDGTGDANIHLKACFEGEAVPTGVDMNGGHLYVGQLTGFPIVQGAAKVFKLNTGGGNSHISTFLEGFTTISDIALDHTGDLYVLETGTLAAGTKGTLWKVNRHNHDRTKIADYLDFPMGLAVTDDYIFVAHKGNVAEDSEILRFRCS